MFLQSYVTPICLFEDKDGVAKLRSLVGTSFFVGRQGYFLTARHVVERAVAQAESYGCEVGLVVKNDNGQSDEDGVLPLGKYEFAPAPFDIAAGWVSYSPNSPLRVQPFEVSVWQEVAVLGYPESASVMEDAALWTNIRGYRGYIHRATLPRDMPSGYHPDGFELSFLLGPGSSGGPVFTAPDQILIGVAVGSYKSEHIEEEFTEVNDKGMTYREQRVRIEQFGFAHDISGLLAWKADIFGGATLQEVAQL